MQRPENQEGADRVDELSGIGHHHGTRHTGIGSLWGWSAWAWSPLVTCESDPLRSWSSVCELVVSRTGQLQKRKPYKGYL